jgi:hypothetical protein
MHRSLLLLLLLPFEVFPQIKEPWISKPKDQWPTIALVNDVLYKNGDRHQDPSVSYAGSGFLLNMGYDTFAVTVKHVLYAARNNATDRVLVNDRLKKWKMYPKDNPKDSVVVGRLINEDKDEKLWSEENGVLQRDWIVFTTKYISSKITPLRLGWLPVTVSERVHVIGNPYRFEKTLLVSGTVVKKVGAHLHVKFDNMNKQFLGGASGSPVINNMGHLIGIFSNSIRDPKTGETTFIINTTDYLKKILKGETPLNVDKRSASKWLDSLVQQAPVKSAVDRFTKMIEDPRSGNVYELHYLNHGHLQRIGDNLLNANRITDAIFYLSYFATRYRGSLGFHLSLARAYRKNGENKKAITVLKQALTEVFEEDKPEIEKLLKEFR